MSRSDCLNLEDMESVIAMLLSAASAKQFGFDFKQLSNFGDEAQPSSIGMKVASELLKCSMIPSDRGGTFLTDVWKYCSSALQSNEVCMPALRDFLMIVLLNTMPAENISSPFPPGAMFDLWALVAGNVATKLAAQFCHRLEVSLAALFEAIDGQGTWSVYRRVCSMTPLVFVNLCLNSLLKRDEFINDSDCSLLPSVLKYDCSSFICLTSLLASIDTDSSMSTSWDSGRLDGIAATFVMETSKQKEANKIIAAQSFADAAQVIGRRFLILLAQKVSDSATHLLVLPHPIDAYTASFCFLSARLQLRG